MLKLKLGGAKVVAPVAPKVLATSLTIDPPKPAAVTLSLKPKLKIAPSIAKSREEVGELSIDQMLSMPANEISLAKSAPTAEANKGLSLPSVSKATPSSEFISHLDADIYKIEELDVEAFINRLFQVSITLDLSDPDLPQYVRMIYKDLLQYPELAHLLTEEQIGFIVNGVLTAKQAFIKTPKPKKKSIGTTIDLMTDKDLGECF